MQEIKPDMVKVVAGDVMQSVPTVKVELVKAGIKQEELMKLTGIPRNTISRIMNGQLPNIIHAQKIARVLQMSVEQLWPLEEIEKATD